MLCNGVVVGFAVDRGQQLALAVGRTMCQERDVRFAGAQCAFEMHGGSGIDGTVRLDLVPFGDHGGGVSEEGGGCVNPDAARNHSRPGPAVPAQADPAASEICELEELPERAADVVRAERTSGAAGEKVRVVALRAMSAIRRRRTTAANSGTGIRRMDASVLGRGWRSAPLPLRCTTVPLTLAIIPEGKSSMSQGRSASTSPGRMAVPRRTSMMSRT